GAQGDGGDSSQRRAHDDGGGDAEAPVERGQGGGQGVAANPCSRLRCAPTRSRLRVVDGVGVAVAGQVGGDHVVAVRQTVTELLVHVGGLAAAVEAEDVRRPHLSPLQVV